MILYSGLKEKERFVERVTPDVAFFEKDWEVLKTFLRNVSFQNCLQSIFLLQSHQQHLLIVDSSADTVVTQRYATC